MTNKVTLDFFFDREDDWGANYNNQDFFQYNIERLRWCLVEADHLEGNPFTGCIDLNTLEVKDLKAFDLLYSLDHKELMKMVEDKDWDWIGDDFEHMEAYLSFIMQHDRSFCYSVKGEGYKSDSDYLHIETWSIPEKFLKSDDLRDAYIAGSCNESGDYYVDSDSHGY
jgi:hypothetical protein